MRNAPGSAKSGNPFDRASTQIQLAYVAAGVAPHADAQRATYTVPAGHKAIITSVLVSLMRMTVSAPTGLTRAYVKYTPAGGTAGTLALAFTNNLAVGIGDKSNYLAGHVMGVGDQLEIRTADLATGGTINYDCYVTVGEFDA